jgi:hypothetical protein
VQPPRPKLGLVLIPLLAFLFAWQPDVATAWQGSTDSTTAKKKSSGSKTISAAGSATKSAAKTSNQKASTGAAKQSTAGNSTANNSAAKTPAAKKSTAARRRSKTGSKAAARRAPRQQQPEPDRIREIQQALKDHGYAVEATGAWDSATVEALKKFQADQNIDNLSGRGKLDSLTLIALGLGPKREPPPGSSEAPQRSPEGHFP